jgi:hypothetical protein
MALFPLGLQNNTSPLGINPTAAAIVSLPVFFLCPPTAQVVLLVPTMAITEAAALVDADLIETPSIELAEIGSMVNADLIEPPSIGLAKVGPLIAADLIKTPSIGLVEMNPGADADLIEPPSIELEKMEALINLLEIALNSELENC